MAVLSDPIADFLTRVKNAGTARKESFTAPYSGIKAEIARILAEEGYIWSYEVSGEGKDKVIKVKKVRLIQDRGNTYSLSITLQVPLRHYIGQSMSELQNYISDCIEKYGGIIINGVSIEIEEWG